MVDLKVTNEELDLIKETLKYYKTKVEVGSDWPTCESKQERLKFIEGLLEKLRT